MMMKKLKSDVSELITELAGANSTRLRELWLEHIGRPASLKLRPSMMRPVLAYRIQEDAYSGLRPETERQLRDVLRGL